MNRREICSPTLYRTAGKSGSTPCAQTSTPRQISFAVPGKPVAKARSRSARLPSGGIRHYTPSETARYENLVALAANEAMCGVDTTDDPVWVDVVVTLQVPKSWNKRETEGALAGAIKPTSKPDLSNVLKSIEDGMNGIVYHDDSQIVTVSAMKRYGSTPEVLVTVRW